MEQLESDAADTVVELDELMNRQGTYFNPQLGLLVIVDDSAAIDDEVFNMEAYEGAEWVRISDDVPVDEDQRDVHAPGVPDPLPPRQRRVVSETALEQGDGEHDEDEEGQEPGRED